MLRKIELRENSGLWRNFDMAEVRRNLTDLQIVILVDKKEVLLEEFRHQTYIGLPY